MRVIGETHPPDAQLRVEGSGQLREGIGAVTALLQRVGVGA